MANVYSVGYVAREVGVSEATIRQYCDDKRIEFMRDNNGNRLITEKGLAQAKKRRAKTQQRN